MTASTTNAAIYLRISDADRDDLAAIKRQHEDALTLIIRMGWTVYTDADTKHPEFHGAFVDHSLSASKRNVRRPAYERMVAAIRDGLVHAIVGYDLDRITRQPRQLEDLIDLAEDRGLIVKTLQSDYDLNTEDGRLHARIKATIAKNEVEQKSKRQKRANDQRADNLAPAPVRRVYGFERGNLAPRPDEAAVVRGMFEQADAEPNIFDIAKRLNSAGVSMSTSPARSSTAGKWTPTTVRNILTNPRYAGLIVSVSREERNTMSDTALSRARRDPARWIESPMVTPIIDRDLFESVFAKLADPARKTAPDNKARKHFLTGVMRCKKCNKTLICRQGNGQSFYVCPESVGVARTAGHTQISKAPVEQGVALAVGFTLATRAEDVLAALGAAQGIDTAATSARLDAIDTEVSELIEDRSAGLITAAQSRPTLERLANERKNLEDQLAAAQRANVSTAVLARLAHKYASGYPTGTPRAVVLHTAAKIAADFLRDLDLSGKSSVVATLFNVTALDAWEWTAPPLAPKRTRRTPDQRLVITDRLLAPIAHALAA